MTFFNSVKKYWYIIASVVALVTIASFIISIVQTPEYKSSVQLIVIQKQKENADAYTATRSAETVAGILSNVIYTSTFFDQVMSSGFEVDKNTYSKDLEERKKEWEKAVDARVVGDTGTLQIDVYDKNRNQAEQLAYAIAYVIINNGDQYHGAGSQIETKLIDAPITSDKIARPSILTNILAGITLGIMTSLAIIFLLSERKPKEKYTAGIEVKTMPKIFKKKGDVSKNTVSKNRKIKPVEKNMESSTNKVKERIAAELKDYTKYSQPEKQVAQKIKTEQSKVPQAKEKDVKERLASGMDSLGLSQTQKTSQEEVYMANKMVYTPEEIQQNYQKVEEDKYSPEKVERWIKTGKFE